MFQAKVVEKKKTKKKRIVYAITFFPKIMPFMRQCAKKMVEPERPLMTMQYGALTLCMLHS
jgi:hypothetical protein